MCLIRVSLKGLGSGGLVVEGVGLKGVEGMGSRFTVVCLIGVSLGH